MSNDGAGWNPLVKPEDRYSGKCSARPDGVAPGRLIIHITGQPDFDVVRKRFTEGMASAHYVIKPDGTLTQFVKDADRAWHAGIKKYVRDLYDRKDGSWRKYLRFFKFYAAYPDDAVFLEGDLTATEPGETPELVARADGKNWPDYDYFDARWPDTVNPIGYRNPYSSPNTDTIGIEILSYGSKRPSSDAYTAAMYTTLERLVEALCETHGIEPSAKTILGHEDVNPVERWGWDPNQGFDWSRVRP